jgi:histidinol phosphatase-like enzyme (inositol monophosphatase family)
MSVIPDFDHLEAFAVRLSQAAADVALPLFRQVGLAEVNKYQDDGFDPVTEADKGAERAIRALIAAHFPDHGIIGEEYGEHNKDAEFVWVLDPIDGTRAFICGLPLWTILIGLRYRGKPVLGLIAQPYLSETYMGSPKGAFLLTPQGRQSLHVRPPRPLKDSILVTTDPYLFQGPEIAAVDALRAHSRLIRYGCDAYGFAMVAAGRLDGAFETGLKSWDIEAVRPVIEAAGGVISDWRGQDIGLYGGQVLASSSRNLQAEALGHLRAAGA